MTNQLGPISGNSIKYLGVVIDKELSWKQHAEHITSKLSIALGIFHKLKYYVSQSTLIQVYYGLVYPYLHYAITTWSCTAKKYLHTIQVLQNKIVKIITNKVPAANKALQVIRPTGDIF